MQISTQTDSYKLRKMLHPINDIFLGKMDLKFQNSWFKHCMQNSILKQTNIYCILNLYTCIRDYMVTLYFLTECSDETLSIF